MRRRDHDLPTPARTAVAAVVAMTLLGSPLLLAGCALGERPTLDSTPTAAGTATGDASIDAVLQRLDGVSAASFSATYTARLAFSGAVADVAVTQDGPSARRSVTIGDIRFLHDQATAQTCRLSSGSCTPEIEAQAVSDTGVTPDFAFGDLARRLRRHAAAQIGPATASTTDTPGGAATCVAVPVGDGTVSYCVLDNGVITNVAAGDVTIDMVSYAEGVDEQLLTTTGS